MSKRLYQVTDTQTRKPVPETFFSEKRLAKSKREELNASQIGLRYIVSPGPDHKNYKG